jgi:hypothetical protein
VSTCAFIHRATRSVRKRRLYQMSESYSERARQIFTSVGDIFTSVGDVYVRGTTS